MSVDEWCWGHDTAVQEANVGDLATGSGTGSVSGSGDDELLTLSGSKYWTLSIVEVGSVEIELSYDKYKTGSGDSGGYIGYRTGSDEAACEAAIWNNYSTHFSSLGWIQIYLNNGTSVKAVGASWDESDPSPLLTRVGSFISGQAAGSSPGNAYLPVQAKMRRCILSDAGVVQYYLCATDSTKKADCSTGANLDGSDGQVMVEIPKFYYRYSYSGTIHEWQVSLFWLPGFKLHPAFNKDGSEVDHRYIGAYEGVLYDTSEGKYVNGLYLPSSAAYTITFTNADDKILADVNTHAFTNVEVGVDKIVISSSDFNNGTYDIVTQGDNYITVGVSGTLTDEATSQVVIQVQRDWTVSIGDKLGSVSGKAPMNYGTRANFRETALNRGTGWRQQDYDLVSAVQLLYLVEYASFYSQSVIGAGLTDWSSAWLAWSNYNPIEKTGLSNSLGNASGNVSNGNGNTGSYMSYRGIENFFGHIWKWVDGFNINGGIPYVSNTETHFDDNTDTNYTRLEDTGGSGITLPQGSNDYQTTLEQIDRGFLPSALNGSDSTYITDFYYQASGWRVALLGGHASTLSKAGFFYWFLYYTSSSLFQSIGGRVCF